MDVELPDGWAAANLGEVVESTKGKVPKEFLEYPEEGYLPYVDIAAFETGNIKRWVPFRNGTEVTEGDVLVVWDGARFGLCGKFQNGVLGSTLVRLRSEFVLRDYLLYFVRYHYKTINSRPRGTGTPHVEPEVFWKLPINVPPLDEQHRIVEKIETLFAQLDHGEAALRQVQTLLTRYRQSVLKATVTGELTADWRAQRTGQLEHGRDLLARILQTRREQWQGRGKYKEPAAPDTSDLPELPQGWVWVTLGALIENGPQNGLYLPVTKYGRGIPILRIDDYQVDWIRARSDLRLVDVDDSEMQKYSLRVGDFVINRVNSISHLGKSLLVCKDYAGAVFESNMMRFSISSQVCKEYLHFYLTGEVGRKRLIKNCKHAVNQASINQGDIANTPIPLPPFDEQEKIAQILLDQYSRELLTGDICRTELTRSAALRQSILKDAFSGKLVPQDPSDEPAAELLARIRAERGTAARKNRRRKENP